MSEYWFELSAENPELARAELEGAAAALGAEIAGDLPGDRFPRCVPVELTSRPVAERLSGRLGLARRSLFPLAQGSLRTLERAAGVLVASSETAAFRDYPGSPTSGPSAAVLALGTAFTRAGGRIDLSRPARRFWVGELEGGSWILLDEVAAVDRGAFSRRAMTELPFRRPVSLSPRLGRAAANLARIRSGDLVADPFLGTGALAIEAGLLGAELIGVDRDPTMVRGALANLSHVGLTAKSLTVQDAAETGVGSPAALDAILTDPPYGRASGSGGEDPESLVRRVLPLWATRLRPGGRLVVILPGGPDPVDRPFQRVLCIRDRVHRSLTREFRVYAREGEERAVS